MSPLNLIQDSWSALPVRFYHHGFTKHNFFHVMLVSFHFFQWLTSVPVQLSRLIQWCIVLQGLKLVVLRIQAILIDDLHPKYPFVNNAAVIEKHRSGFTVFHSSNHWLQLINVCPNKVRPLVHTSDFFLELLKPSQSQSTTRADALTQWGIKGPLCKI